MEKRIECGFAGRSMGFDYLSWIRNLACRFKVVGKTFIRSDGSIIVVAEGKERNLKRLARRLGHGHFWHQIENFYIKWKEATGEFSGFFVEKREV